MNKAILLLALLAMPAFAQERKTLVADDSQRKGTYEFQYANAQADVVNLVRSYFGGAANLSYFPALNSVVVQTYNPDDLPKVLAMLKKYDVPKAEAEVTAYLVLSSNSGPPWPGGKPLPAELQSAIAQMKQTLTDKSYSLREVVETRSSSSASIDGDVPETGTYSYTLSYEDIRVSRDSKSVQIGSFHFTLRPCPNERCHPVSLVNSEFVLQEGQKLVFGKLPVSVYSNAPVANTARTGDLYVILTAKIQPGPK